VYGKNKNANKESQAPLMTDQGHLRAALQLRKQKSSTSLHQTIHQRPKLQSSRSGSVDYKNLREGDTSAEIPDSGEHFGNVDFESER
jgi:hypothetical protein